MSRATPRIPTTFDSFVIGVATSSTGIVAPDFARIASSNTGGDLEHRPVHAGGARAIVRVHEGRELLADPLRAGPPGDRLEGGIERFESAVRREREDDVAGGLDQAPVALLGVAQRGVDLLAPPMRHLEGQEALDDELAGCPERARSVAPRPGAGQRLQERAMLDRRHVVRARPWASAFRPRSYASCSAASPPPVR